MKIVRTLTTTGTIIFDNDTRVMLMLPTIAIKILLLGLVVDAMYSDDVTR